MDEKREQLITEICLSLDEEEVIAQGLAARLAASGLPEEERAELEANAPRLLLYRRLVRGNLEAAARRLLPRTVACLEQNGSAAFAHEFALFLAESCTRTHYLRDIGVELARWGAPRWAAPGFPPYLTDLARYEVLEFDVAIALPPEAPAAMDELALDRAVVFEPPARLAYFAHAVHEEDDPPAPRDAAVLVFRDAEHAIHAREIAPAVAPVLERLLAGESLANAVRGPAPAHESAAPMDDTLLARVAEVLAELAAERVLLGAAA